MNYLISPVVCNKSFKMAITMNNTKLRLLYCLINIYSKTSEKQSSRVCGICPLFRYKLIQIYRYWGLIKCYLGVFGIFALLYMFIYVVHFHP